MHSKRAGIEVITGEFIRQVIDGARMDIIDVVCQSYLAHHHGRTENPDSYFLRFKDRPEARIIALPAAIDDAQSDVSVSGIKWIASYPRNIDDNLQRASAVILLNDYDTGFPFACLEASQISAARTAASAVLAASHLGPKDHRVPTLAIVGAGYIARTILAFFHDAGWKFDDVLVHDLSAQNRDAFVRNTQPRSAYRMRPADDLASALSADIVVFATTAGTPYVTGENMFAPGQLVLNVSLRDLSPEIIQASNNVLDDVNHCMKADTSPHLAEQKYGHREFVTGTLAQIITEEVYTDTDKPIIFSPFGLGILDLSLAMFIYRQNLDAPGRHKIPRFFSDTQRWGL